MARKFSRGSGRLTTWFQFQPASVVGSVSGNLVFSLNVAALALRPFTVVRTHFMCLIRSDQAAAIETQVGALGFAVVSDEAVAIGVAAIPTPITQMASDLWFVHQMLMAYHQEITDRAEPAGVFEIDSKAMCKVGVGQDIVVVTEVSTAEQGADFVFGGCMLIKTN